MNARLTMPRWAFLPSAAGLMVVWAVLSNMLQTAGQHYGGMAVTLTIFVLLGALALESLVPELSVRVKWLLMLGLMVKITLSLWYFDSFFVTRMGGDSVTIKAYGDSYIHHKVAVMLMNHWSKELINPIVASHLSGQFVEQWGYSFFLSLLYSVTGPMPETGIIANGLLGFLTCLLGYKLFLLAGLSRPQAFAGLLILFLSPILWLWGSLLYKDSLLYLIVVTCTVLILRLFDNFQPWRLVALVVLLLVLIPIRYSFTIPLVVLLTFGSFYFRPLNVRYAFALFAIGCLTLSLLNWSMNYFNIHHETAGVSSEIVQPKPAGGSSEVVSLKSVGQHFVTNIVEAAAGIMESKPTGGRFMESIIGSQPTWTNFMYVLPARAFYILMIPMPWFGGQSVQEQIDYVLSHVDAVFYFSLIAAMALLTFNRGRIPISRTRYLLLGMGLLYFAVPLFFFSPARRYVSISVPFFLAYAMPYLLHKRKAAYSVGVALGVIFTIQFFYYFALNGMLVDTS